jgi:acyl carrier protein
MTIDEAREHIVAAADYADNVLNKPSIAATLNSVHADMALADLGFDSLVAMEFCLNLEDRTGVPVDLGDLAIHSTVNALAAHLVARQAAA